MPIITLTTDFGVGSSYVAVMKGVILSINPDATLVDVAHNIAPQDVSQAAILLDQASSWFPPGSIHLAVVDPGVGTARAILYASVGGQHYVAPDNGLLTHVVARHAPDQLIRLTNPRFWLPGISATFHGRDIMSPVVARLSLGLNPQQLGPSVDELVKLDVAAPQVIHGELHGCELQGRVICIDPYGNLITNLTRHQLQQVFGLAAVHVQCAARTIDGLVTTYADRPLKTLVALFGSSDFLEIAVVSGNAAQYLNAAVGSIVCVSLRT